MDFVQQLIIMIVMGERQVVIGQTVAQQQVMILMVEELELLEKHLLGIIRMTVMEEKLQLDMQDMIVQVEDQRVIEHNQTVRQIFMITVDTEPEVTRKIQMEE